MSVATIFVPHQDDEINLVGNILSQLTREYEVYIVYSSIDSAVKKGNIRKREAIAACDVYSIKKDHIIFMGYPDTPNKEGHHYFTDGNKEIVLDIEQIINKLRPKLIIGTDFDFHSDHRMLSIALDEAIRKVILGDADYRPRYLKGFCYETAYYGVDDYSATSLADTVVGKELLGNLTYRWKDRISIKSNEKEGLITKKKAFKALKCHKSQHAILHARSIINADNVFWEKRTDNLLLDANVKITTTSGDESKLNDFKVIDSNDIITIDQTVIDYGKCLWRASERSAKICIDWPKPVRFDRIVLHGNPSNTTKQAIKINVIDGDKKKLAEMDKLEEYGRATQILFGETANSRLILDIDAIDGVIELSELEIYYGENPHYTLLGNINKSKKEMNCIIDFIDRLIFKSVVIIEKTNRKCWMYIKKLLHCYNYLKHNIGTVDG